MRYFTLTVVLLLILNNSMISQVPQKMSYQAIIRNASGELVKNVSVSVSISVRLGATDGQIVFNEFFFPLPTTNENGLLTIDIGSGFPQIGSFSNIDWGADSYFIEVGVDPSGGNNYTLTTISQLMSTPYALLAKDVENVPSISLTDLIDVNAINSQVGQVLQWNGSMWVPEAINEVNPTVIDTFLIQGNILLISLMNDEVPALSVDLSGLGADDWGSQSVNSNTTLEGNGTNSSPLGIANNSINSSHIINGSILGEDISGVGASPNNVLRFNGTQWLPGPDGPNLIEGTGISIIGNPQGTSYTISTTGLVGGSGTPNFLPKWNTSTSLNNSIIRQTSNQIFINDPIGTGGKINVKGDNGGYAVYGESDFKAIAGQSTGGDGVYGFSQTGNGVYGNSQSLIGVYGKSTSNNGVKAESTTGIAIVASSSSGVGINVSSGSNTGLIVGSNSGAGVSVNVGAGKMALQALQGNVFVGTGSVGIGTSAFSYRLQLNTNSAAKPTSGTWTVSSDARLKKNVHAYEDGLEEILQIKPVWFTYTGEAGMPEETGVGVLAQELQEISPYMVGTWKYREELSEQDTEYLNVDNGPMVYMLINAIKEQQNLIIQLQFEMKALKQEIFDIKNK